MNRNYRISNYIGSQITQFRVTALTLYLSQILHAFVATWETYMWVKA